jgi:hypothetical protein
MKNADQTQIFIELKQKLAVLESQLLDQKTTHKK